MNNEIWSFRSIKNSLLEHVTPHKICIVILIQEYCLLKSKGSNTYRDKQNKNQFKRVLFMQDMKPAYRRDFSMLALHLIQSPDMEYDELMNLLESDKYLLLPELLTNFKTQVKCLVEQDVGSVMDVLTQAERFLIEPNNFEVIINKSSKIGLFLRRVRLFFDKLSFSQTVGMYKAFQNYVQAKKKLDVVTGGAQVDSSALPAKINESRHSMDIELSSILEDSSIMNFTQRILPKEVKDVINESDGIVSLWSRRQAELFIAQQSKLLINNPTEALPPQKLQAKIQDVLATNPEHAEAHYLSYLNCMRAKEFCGSIDSLFHYFDRKATGLYEDETSKCKGLRYAALNLAILHARFNHKNEALSALKEAITLSHEANDNVCLQHAQAWMYTLTNENADILMERSVSKSNELNLNYLSSLGLQSYAQYAAKHGGLPSHIFELLSKSDVLNSQYSMMDLLSLGFVHKSALWSMYGQSDLASLSSQQLLHLASNPPCSSINSGEAFILAISNIANYFTMQGDYQIAWLLVNHGKEKVPDSKWWLWSENILYFTESLHKGLWQHAQAAVNQLATVDKSESLLRLSQLYLAKGDKKSALETANKVLSTADCPMLKIRASLLAAKCNPMMSILALCDAYHISNFHSIHYWMKLIALEMANIQLEMGLPCQAMKLADQNLLGVLSHGCYAEISDGLVLFAKCKVATAATAPFSIRAEMISEATKLLDKAAEYAKQIEDYSRVKRIVYLQALLCNSIGMVVERNKYAFEFRTLDEQFPTNNSSLYIGQ